MLEFLCDFGISSSTIKVLEDNNYDSILYSLKTNEFEIGKIINYLKEIGIKDIEGLLINNTELFFKTFREFDKVLGKYDKLQLAEFINNDIDNIGLLFKRN